MGIRRVAAKQNPWLPFEAVATASFVIGAEAGDAINVGVQLKDSAGQAIVHRAAVDFYVSGDANGDTIIGTAPTTLVIGTDGLLIPRVAGKEGLLVSEATGHLDINFGTALGTSYYLVLVMPGGRLVVSPAITFATTTTTTTTTTP